MTVSVDSSLYEFVGILWVIHSMSIERPFEKKKETIDQHCSVDKRYVPMLKDELITFWLKVKTIISRLKLD